MSRIKNLLAENEGRIYVYLKDKEVANQFMIDAENEGFTFSDGKSQQKESLPILWQLIRTTQLILLVL